MKYILNKINLGLWEYYIEFIPNNFIDFILTDPPYNTTSCSWDKKIDLKFLFFHLNRIIKDKGVIAVMGSQPFTTDIINANRKYFKYEWIWQKNNVSNFILLRFQPGKAHENILIFSKAATSFVKNNNNMNYYPICTPIKRRIGKFGTSKLLKVRGKLKNSNINITRDELYPKSILTFSIPNKLNRINSTQKPIDLFSYLIKTYTKEKDLVFDPFSGSGTTAISSKLLKRNFICFEQDYIQYVKSIERLKYYNTIKKELF